MQYLLNIFGLTAKNQMMEGKTEGRDPSRQVAREGLRLQRYIRHRCIMLIMMIGYSHAWYVNAK